LKVSALSTGKCYITFKKDYIIHTFSRVRCFFCLIIVLFLVLMKELTIIFFCSWKFAATFPVAVYVMKMSFAETLIYTNIGGILGTLISVYLSEFLLKIWREYWPWKLKHGRKQKRIFTKRNRWFVKIKTKYGLFGIVVLSPVLLSIPLGSFLTVKYYGMKKTNVLWLIAGQVLWSFVYTGLYTQVKAIVA
jgi:hypothetical protein